MLLLFAAACTSNAQSADSVSHSVWRISKDEVILQVSFPKVQGESLKGELNPLSVENLGKYVLERVSVTAGGDRCPPVDQGYDLGEVDPLALDPSLYGFEIIFSCPADNSAGVGVGAGVAAELTLHNGLFFAEQPTHIDFASIVKDGLRVADTFTASRQFMSVPRNAALTGTGRGRFARLGLSHIWRSADQWLALGGLLLILRGRNWPAAAIAGVSGYLIAAAAVTAGGLIPFEHAAGVGMGLVVAGLAVVLVSRAVNDTKILSRVLAIAGIVSGAVAWFSHRPDATLLLLGFGVAAAATVRLPAHSSVPGTSIALLYGLIDGLALPTDFVRLQIWGDLSAKDSLVFGAGALLGVSLLMVLLASTFWLLRKKWPSAALADGCASTAMAGFGVFWIVSRLL
jgi:hypothetical protein